MRTPTTTRPITVVLLGNPNTGKSTLFAGLVGIRQRTGNYPGVTVEKKVGRTKLDDVPIDVVDLPGTYSLAPHSPDEMVAVDVLLGRQPDVTQPDVVVCIVDASNLQRNLYLVSQVLELGLPTILALNMTDIARSRGQTVDIGRLSQNLSIPVVETQANRKRGIDDIKNAIVAAASEKPQRDKGPLPEDIQGQLDRIQSVASQQGDNGTVPRYLLQRLLFDTGYLQHAKIPGVTPEVRQCVADARGALSETHQSLAAAETMARYQWVGEVTADVITQDDQTPRSWQDRLDWLLTHRLWGTSIFLVLMIVIFQSVFSWAGFFMDAIDAGVTYIGTALGSTVPAGPFQSLLTDGIVGGVGAVLVFLPQIFILFFFIALLEDCGYMARAAYLMDKLMSRIGLSGKSFIPLLSSFACAIPGIMATRVIENRRDRLVTILIAPLMSCSARLPVYILLIAAFIPDRPLLGGVLGLQGFTLFCMYLVGMVVAIAVALTLKKTVLPGETPPFVLELPSYKLPDAKIVLYRMADRGWAFVRRAGTLIFAVTIVVWAAGYFPRDPQSVASLQAEKQELVQRINLIGERPNQSDTAAIEPLQTQLRQLENQIQGKYVRNSYLGRMGQFIQPVVQPLGWDWKIGCAVIASFPAREVVVGTLSVIYNLGEDDEPASLQKKLQEATWQDSGQPVFNIPVALSIMVFFALCAQCVSTIAVIARETNSWRWPIFSFVYMTALAYLGAWLIYNVSRLFIT